MKKKAAKRQVTIDKVDYESVSAAARALGLPGPTVVTRLLSKSVAWRSWFYSDGLPVAEYKKKLFADRPKEPVMYRFTHVPTGAFYVGSTNDFPNRRNGHIGGLRNQRHACHSLQRMWNADPDLENWSWSVVLCSSREHAYKEEQAVMDVFKGSNLILNESLDAYSPITGVINRPDVRAKLRNTALRERRTYDYRDKQSALMKAVWSQPGRREARAGAGNPFAKAITVDGTTYGSVKDAVKAVGISEKTLRKRANLDSYPNIHW